MQHGGGPDAHAERLQPGLGERARHDETVDVLDHVVLAQREPGTVRGRLREVAAAAKTNPGQVLRPWQRVQTAPSRYVIAIAQASR